MKKKVRRLLSFLLIFAMLFSLAPTNAFAWNGGSFGGGHNETDDAYFYVLKPNYSGTLAGADKENFYFVGEGTVSSNVKEVFDTSGKDVQNYIIKEPNVTIESLEQLGVPEAEDFYSRVGADFQNVTWYRTVYANGANANGGNTAIVPGERKCWHVDGIAGPLPNTYQVRFVVPELEDTAHNPLISTYTVDVNNAISEDNVDQATDEANKYTSTDKTVVWYFDEEFNNEATPQKIIEESKDQKSQEVLTIYGRYEPIQAAKLSIQKNLTQINRDGTSFTQDLSNDTRLQVGDQLTWTITVKNTGNLEAANVALEDNLQADSEHRNIGIILPENTVQDNFTVSAGGSVEFTASYTVTAADAGKTLENTATVTYNGQSLSASTSNVVDEITTHTITINYVNGDDNATPLHEPTITTGDDGDRYSITVDKNKTGVDENKEIIPFIIDNNGTQYVFDHFTEDSDELSGTLNNGVEITAEYLIDANKNKVPDEYEATVTYIVKNGTWDGTQSEDIVKDIPLYEFTGTQWVEINATLGDTIPNVENAQPDEGYVADDAGWNDTAPTKETKVTEDVTYTYSFKTQKKLSIDVSKTVYSIKGKLITDSENLTADVDDTVIYKIVVSNDGNVDLNNVSITDTLTIGSKTQNLDLYKDSECKETVAESNIIIPKKTSQTFYAKYTVSEGDKGQELSNAVTAQVGENGPEAEDTAENIDVSLTLTYDANGGKFGSTEDQIDVAVQANSNITLWTKGEGDQSDSGIRPENTEFPTHEKAAPEPGSQLVDVVFMGWTTEPSTEEDKIYKAGDEYPELITSIDEFNADTIVYAVWGYDEYGNGTTGGDKIPDAQQVVITPADITVYTGGTGYTGVLGSNGEGLGTTDNGLPEPGYYFILPYELNKQFGQSPDQMVNLSKHLRLDYENNGDKRSWILELYNSKADENENIANERYIYRLVPDGEKKSARLEIHDGDTNTSITSDHFNNFNLNTLYKEYTMNLYTDTVEQDLVKVSYTVNGTKWIVADDIKGLALDTGKLTVRGTTDQEHDLTSSIQSEVTDKVNNITASDLNQVTYYTNGSIIPVVNQDSVQLLVDEVVEDAQGALKDTIVDAAAKDDSITIDEDYTFDFNYLDLVDTSNGNAYVTMDKDQTMTLFWPYPDNMDASDTYYIAHFNGLDRNYDNLETALADESTTIDLYSEDTDNEDLKLEKTENGIKITVSSFSPFALVYDADQGSGGNTGGGTTPNPPALNTEDHFSYVVGYEDGMVKPENAITRAEVASIFYRLLKDDVRDANTTDVSEFSDVSASDWYGTTVATLSAMDIVRGYEDGTFRPNAPITRAEFAAIATRFFEETGAEYEPGTFDDVTGDEWFANAIADAVELGLIGGYPDGTVRPNNNITRAEACAIVNRTLGRIPHVDHLLPADEMTTWPDNNPSDWFYADMQEATNGHEYEWTTEQGQKVEEWTEILDKDWEDR